jgi:hypothetical protein
MTKMEIFYNFFDHDEKENHHACGDDGTVGGIELSDLYKYNLSVRSL